MSQRTEKIERFKAVVSLSPDDELAQFTLGQALFEEGRFEEAKNHLGKACELKGDWMVPAILYSKCLLELGEKEKARPALERALQLAREQHHDSPAEELEFLISEL